ncbi:MAG: response regulator transcription factor [Acidobacteriota bacterium]
MTTHADTKTPEPSAAPSTVEIKVAIVEDQRNFREYLAALIDGSAGFRCAGSFRSMEEALDRIRIGFELPDVVLVDIGLPGMDGIEGIRILKERLPRLILLMHTVYDGDERIFDALCAGANGYLLKKTSPARLLESLREALDGGAPMTPEVAHQVVKLFREIRPPERLDEQLTPHEIRLLEMLAEGDNYETAAAELAVTTHTISFHLQRIYEKLHVHSKTEAVAKALRNRLIK